MPFSMEALQSRSRQRADNDNCKKCERAANRKQDQPIVATIGQVVKGLAGTISNAINGIWHKKSKPNDRVAVVDDVTVEDDFVEVALITQLEKRREQSTESNFKKGPRLPASKPIDIPKSRRPPRPERKEVHFI